MLAWAGTTLRFAPAAACAVALLSCRGPDFQLSSGGGHEGGTPSTGGGAAGQGASGAGGQGPGAQGPGGDGPGAMGGGGSSQGGAGGQAAGGGGGDGGVGGEGGGGPVLVSVDVTLVGVGDQPLFDAPVLVSGADGVATDAGHTDPSGALTVMVPPDGSVTVLPFSDSAIVAAMAPGVSSIRFVEEGALHDGTPVNVQVSGTCPDCNGASGRFDFYASCLSILATGPPVNGAVSHTFNGYDGCPASGLADFIIIKYDASSNPKQFAKGYGVDYSSGSVPLGAFTNMIAPTDTKNIQFDVHLLPASAGKWNFIVGRLNGHFLGHVAEGSKTSPTISSDTQILPFPNGLFDVVYALQEVYAGKDKEVQVKPFNGNPSSVFNSQQLGASVGTYAAAGGGSPATVQIDVTGATGDAVFVDVSGNGIRWQLWGPPSTSSNLVLPTLPAQYVSHTLPASPLVQPAVIDITSAVGYAAALQAGTVRMHADFVTRQRIDP